MPKGPYTTKCVWMYVCLAVLALLISVGRVQGQAETATISGTATDASGGALASAKVEATNVGTNVAQSTATDAQGRYSMAQLRLVPTVRRLALRL